MLKVLPLLGFSVLAAVSFAQAKPLAGSVGVIGKPATLGKYQFALVSASFATRVVAQDAMILAPKGKKFLILNYTVQNPTQGPLDFARGDIRFTVVGADNADHEDSQNIYAPDTMAPLAVSLKPVQKIPVLTYVEVPANDPIPKLMAMSGAAPVLRFDLKGKVKKFTGPFAKADGVTVEEAGSVPVGTKFEAGTYDVVVEKVEDVTTNLGEFELGEDRKFIVVTITLTNASKTDLPIDTGFLNFSMKDAAGEDVEFGGSVLKGVGNTYLSGTLKPGASVKARVLFTAAKDANASSVTVTSTETERSVTVSFPK
jgi:hypothetical protein